MVVGQAVAEVRRLASTSPRSSHTRMTGGRVTWSWSSDPAFENSVPYYLGIVDDSHFHYGTQCAKGTGITNYQPRTWYTNQLLLVSPGVTSFSTVKCTYTSTLHGYELHVIEMDGTAGREDDFGRRFFYAFGSGAPYNASPNTLENYYKKSGVPTGDHSQVALTLEVR